MLQNARVTTFTVSELLREIWQGGVVKLPLPPPRLELRSISCLLPTLISCFILIAKFKLNHQIYLSFQFRLYLALFTLFLLQL